MNAVQMQLACGFADPVHDAQQVFRTVLEAMAHPGRVLPLAGRFGGLDGLAAEVPAPLAAALLALADFETPVWLAPAAVDGLAALLRFHCGTPIVAEPQQASFAVAAGGALPALDALPWGSPEYPDRGATLMIAVESLTGGSPRRLTGPGIAAPLAFAPRGLPPRFWEERRLMQADFPRGVDCLLFDRERVAALPRTTVAVEN